MYVELIGATGAGKTTLAKQLVHAGQSLGCDVWMSDDFILSRFNLNFVRSEFMRRRLVEMLGFLAVPFAGWRHHKFLWFAVRESLSCPGAMLYRASVARIVIKKIGLRAIVCGMARNGQIVLADNEGVVQAAHTLYVHGRGFSQSQRLQEFARLVPLPEVLVCLRQSDNVLVERTLARGHRRLEQSAPDRTAAFIQEAQQVFDSLQKHQSIAERSISVDAANRTMSVPHNLSFASAPPCQQLLDLVSSEIESSPADDVPPPTFDSARQSGKTIAIVGADATGKSTLVDAIAHWLSKTNRVKKIHAGKPPGTWLTFPVNALLPLAKRMFPKLKGKQSAGSKSSKDEADNGNDKNPSLLYAVRAVALAWDRRRLLLRAKRQAANGNMVVCDRYPTEIVGAMDSPRLESCEGRRNWKGRLLNRLATIEQRLYRDVPAPDLVLRLQVTLETARKRNRQRDEHDPEDYLERRHREQRPWSKPGTGSIIDIDTEQGREQTTLAAKQAIAGEL